MNCLSVFHHVIKLKIRLTGSPENLWFPVFRGYRKGILVSNGLFVLIEVQKQPPEVFRNKGVLKNFAIFRAKGVTF